MDALPAHELIADAVEHEGSYCALGAVARQRGTDLSGDLYDAETLGGRLDIPRALAAEIVFENDEGSYRAETPEQRFSRMRKWLDNVIVSER